MPQHPQLTVAADLSPSSMVADCRDKKRNMVC